MAEVVARSKSDRHRIGRLALVVLANLCVAGIMLFALWPVTDAQYPGQIRTMNTGAGSAFAGQITVQDIDTGSPSLSSDRLVVSMSDVGAPPAGRTLQAYLLDHTEHGIFAGVLPVSGGVVNATIDQPGRNLIGSYSNARIVLEGAVFDAALPGAAVTQILPAVLQATDTPNNIGYSVGLVQQAELLDQHAGFARDAANGGNLTAAKIHAEHVLNILYGSSDSRYGDHDNDGITENPGDGYGVLRYSSSLSQTVQLAAAAGDATSSVIQRAAEVQTTLRNIGSSSEPGAWSPLLIARATDLLAAATPTDAQTAANQLVGAATRIYHGVDLNDNGEVEPVPDEGGSLTAHRYTQRIADYVPPSAGGITGSVQHQDAGAGRNSDQLRFVLSGLPALSAGEEYWAYLLHQNGSRLWLGSLPGAGGAIDATKTVAGVNLIEQYNQLFLTIGSYYAAGSLPVDALTHIRTAIHQAGDTPGQKGYAVGLMSQGQILLAHANLAKTAADNNNLTNASLHAEHVLNTLYGVSDPRYDDHDGNGLEENPGDGYGFLRYSGSLFATLQLAADSAGASQNIRDRVAEVQTTVTNIGTSAVDSVWSATLVEKAEEILNAATAADAQTAATQLVAAADRLLNGTDLNDNSVVEPIAGEGGATTAYRHTQHAADYTLALQSPSQPPTATPTTDPNATATPTPVGTAQPPNADVYEDNDTCNGAKAISPTGSETQMHTFHDAGDADWVKFSAQANKTYRIKVDNVGPLADAILYLHDACATAPSAFEGQAFGSTVELEWDATKTGDYFIQLQQFDPSFFGADAHYHLSVQIDTAPPAAPRDLRCIAANETTVGLQWKKNSERDVVRYRVTFRNENATDSGNRDIEGANETFLELGSLTPNELYFLQAIAVDYSGNESAPSGEIPCRAASSTDPTQPSITLQQPAASTIVTTTAAQMTFTGVALDSGGNLSQVRVRNNTKNVEGHDFSLAGSSANFRVENLPLDVGENSMLVTVQDGAGNSSERSLVVRRMGQRPGGVIVVAGHNETFGLQTNIYNAANRAYRIFKTAGFSDDDIFYISPVGQDADNNGVIDTDAAASPAAVQNAITTWAKENGRVGPDKPLFLYMIDHGFAEKFCASGCNAGGVITPADLDGWLRTLETDTGVDQVNVVIEACESGSFIDREGIGGVANSLSKAGRVIITSTGSDNNAYASAQGAYFSDAFFSCLADSNNLKVCFDQANDAVAATGVNQTPRLDDNGDGVFNSGDGAVAQARTLTSFFSSVRPQIADVLVTQTGADGTLTATVSEGAEAIDLVWAAVYPPSFQEPDDVTLNLNVPTVRLEPDPATPGRYLFNYVNGFSESGDYRIIFYAQDQIGLHAVPKVEGEAINLFLPLVAQE